MGWNELGGLVQVVRRFMAALPLVLLTACHSWQPTTISPRGWTSDERPSSVRATLTSGDIMTVSDPTLRNDSIVGAMVGVASRDVRLLEVKRFSPLKTVGLVFVTATGITTLALVLFLASDFSFGY